MSCGFDEKKFKSPTVASYVLRIHLIIILPDSCSLFHCVLSTYTCIESLFFFFRVLLHLYCILSLFLSAHQNKYENDMGNSNKHTHTQLFELLTDIFPVQKFLLVTKVGKIENVFVYFIRAPHAFHLLLLH